MSQRSDSRTTTVGGSLGKASVSVSHSSSSATPMFPYGCQWGCNRQNVCSAPGNSCGRATCNDNRSKKSMGGGHFSTHATNKK